MNITWSLFGTVNGMIKNVPFELLPELSEFFERCEDEHRHAKTHIECQHIAMVILNESLLQGCTVDIW